MDFRYPGIKSRIEKTVIMRRGNPIQPACNISHSGICSIPVHVLYSESNDAYLDLVMQEHDSLYVVQARMMYNCTVKGGSTKYNWSQILLT